MIRRSCAAIATAAARVAALVRVDEALQQRPLLVARLARPTTPRGAPAGAPASSRGPAAARCWPRPRSSRAATRSRRPASRARRGRSAPPAVAAAAPAARRGTQARSSPARRRRRPAARRSAPISSSKRSGYGWSHGTSAKECIAVSRARSAPEQVEADVRRDPVEPRAEQRAAVEARRGCATPAGTSPARRPRPRRTRRASGSSGRAARAGAARSAPRRRTLTGAGRRHACGSPFPAPARPRCCRRGREARRTFRSRGVRDRAPAPACPPRSGKVADLDAAADELGARRLDVGDDQVRAPERARRRVGDPRADRDRARRARRRQLDDPELVAGAVVDVQGEADLVDVERLGAVDVRDGTTTSSSFQSMRLPPFACWFELVTGARAQR